MNHGRRAAGTTVVVLALAVAASTLCGVFSRTAQAATAYRYWAYYVANGVSWQYSQRGPAAEHPADGAVQGWRFAVQADSTGSLAPRTTPDFAKLCASTAAVAGQLRVGIVLDFGTAADAPAGEKPPAAVVTGCVHVPSGASGVAVLDAAVGTGQVRIGAGLICGIDGYPESECAPAVNVSTPTLASPPNPAPSPAPNPASGAVPARTARPSLTTPAASKTLTATAESGATKAAPASSAPAPAAVPGVTEPSTDPSAVDSSAASGPPVATLDSVATGKGSHHLPVMAILGGVLVVVLGAAAIWRGAVRRG